ncbi:MAG: GAF domain-containing protein [Chloroflexota bacterium]|nr:GAF domain-containing protein [Chloroflexota bacterium]
MKRIWELIGSVSVRTKIMGIVLGLVALLGLGTTFWVRYTLEDALRNQLELRGISVTRDLAARATDLVLTNNTFALHNLVRDTTQNNEDLVYAFILDERGQIIVHSFESGFPKDLRQANGVAGNVHHHLELLNTEAGLVWDFAVPIFDGKAGTARVGISERHLQAAVASTTGQMLTATALASILGIVAGYILTWILTRPILTLVKVTRAVGKGDLSQRAPVWARDEIGQLTVAFNGMVSDLRQERDRSQEYNQQLLRRNRELAALNAVATAMSGSLALNEVLERALHAVLEAMGFSAGWVFLFDQAGLRHTPVCSVGLSADVVAGEGAEPVPCHCHQATEQHKTLVIELTASCPALGSPLARGGRIGCHATVPLMAQDRVLGVLNIAGSGPADFTQDDLELLGAVGHALGVAVENVRLWEELRRKEELRGELLAKVITAQEEERRRIARELHDETGQSLTSLMVGLKVAAESDAPQGHLIELREIAAQTLTGVRDLARELRPSLLDDLGLIAALERYLASYGAKFNLDTDFQATGFGDSRRLTPETEITLYRIIQEALTNVAKHAQAKNVSVVVERKARSVVALVEDDGKGFQVVGSRLPGANQSKGASDADQPGLGLYGMQERAALLGGALTLESSPGQGTTVRVEVPL